MQDHHIGPGVAMTYGPAIGLHQRDRANDAGLADRDVVRSAPHTLFGRRRALIGPSAIHSVAFEV